MAAYISNIVIDAGADFNQIFNLENASNAPLDLSGYTCLLYTSDAADDW